MSGVIARYSVLEGLIVWSTEAHAGSVNTLTELRPGLLCTAGQDCCVSIILYFFKAHTPSIKAMT